METVKASTYVHDLLVQIKNYILDASQIRDAVVEFHYDKEPRFKQIKNGHTSFRNFSLESNFLSPKGYFKVFEYTTFCFCFCRDKVCLKKITIKKSALYKKSYSASIQLDQNHLTSPSASSFAFEPTKFSSTWCATSTRRRRKGRTFLLLTCWPETRVWKGRKKTTTLQPKIQISRSKQNIACKFYCANKFDDLQ